MNIYLFKFISPEIVLYTADIQIIFAEYRFLYTLLVPLRRLPCCYFPETSINENE